MNHVEKLNEVIITLTTLIMYDDIKKKIIVIYRVIASCMTLFCK